MSTARHVASTNPEALRRVCCVCGVVLVEGTGPTSHGYCGRCARRATADLAVTELRKLTSLQRKGEPTEDQFIATVDAIYAVVDAGD